MVTQTWLDISLLTLCVITIAITAAYARRTKFEMLAAFHVECMFLVGAVSVVVSGLLRSSTSIISPVLYGFGMPLRSASALVGLLFIATYYMRNVRFLQVVKYANKASIWMPFLYMLTYACYTGGFSKTLASGDASPSLIEKLSIGLWAGLIVASVGAAVAFSAIQRRARSVAA